MKRKKEKQPVIYKEDLLKQQFFDLQDWRRAKMKHPVRFWFRAKYVSIKNILTEIYYFFIRSKKNMLKLTHDLNILSNLFFYRK